MKPKKFYAHNLTEIRPDTKMIEAKLRQYFEITEQKYEPQSSKNVLLVSFEALSMLAKSEAECKKMNEQWHQLVAMSVITTKETSLFFASPFAANYVLPNDKGGFFAAEINWNPYEALNNHRSFRHNDLSDENICKIRQLHQECREALKDEYDAMLLQLKRKFGK